MRHLLAVAAVLFVIPAAGCGDNLKPPGTVDATTADTAVDVAIIDTPIDTPIDSPIDAVPVDASCPIRTQGQVGGSCMTNPQCDSAPGAGDGYCLVGPQGPTIWPSQGYCVNRTDALGATPCTSDAQCGTGNICATINDPLGAFSACLPACGTGACTCSDGQLCASSFTGSPLTGGDTACLPGNASAQDGSPCTEFGQCAQDSQCINDPFEVPNGQCGRILCTIGNDSTCAGGHCVNVADITSGVFTGTTCVDTCVNNSDCRMAEGYTCATGPTGVGKYCRHPQVGDPCVVATDCGDPTQWKCSGALPAGACTLLAPCPTPGSTMGCSILSSACWEAATPAATDNICVDRCGGPINTAGGCRTGLTCRDLDPDPRPARVTLGCVP